MNKQISKEEIIRFLRDNRDIIKERFGVDKIGLFGSYARGENTPDSDIDLFVELERHTLHDYAGLLIYLENIFGKRIELVVKHNYMKRRFLNNIEKDLFCA